MDHALNVLLIEDSTDYAELVQQWLSTASEQCNFVLNWTDSLASGLRRLAQGGVDVILVDLGLPDSDGLQTYFAVRASAPQTPVIVLSGADNESLALQMIQEGAEDYLVKRMCRADDLIRALRYAVIRRKSQMSQFKGEAPATKTRIAGVLGSKGGVGTTTIACHLAEELRRQTAADVLLMDLDMQAGLIPFLLAIEPKYSILDAVANLDRLDRNCWNGIVARTVSGLGVMAAPAGVNPDELDHESLVYLCNKLRLFHPWVVADLGRMGATPLQQLELCDELFVVTTMSIPALYQAKRTIETLVAARVERDRLRLIINQAEKDHPISGKELNNTFGVPVYGILQSDSEHLREACIKKQLADPNSIIGKQINAIARRIAGLREEPRRNRLADLFSLVERVRRPDSGMAKHGS